LSKDLTATKIELDEEKERATRLATKLKDLEIRYVETVNVKFNFELRK